MCRFDCGDLNDDNGWLLDTSSSIHRAVGLLRRDASEGEQRQLGNKVVSPGLSLFLSERRREVC